MKARSRLHFAGALKIYSAIALCSTFALCFALLFLSASALAIPLAQSHLNGWLITETVMPNPQFRVLLLPGLLETDYIYSSLLQSRALYNAGIQLVAADPPGFKGQTAPADFNYSVDSFTDALAQIESRENFDLVVGHSFFANVIANLVKCTGPGRKFLLLSPSLQHLSEPKSSRFLNWASRIRGVGPAAWYITDKAYSMILPDGVIHDNSTVTSDLVREARLTPPNINRRLLIAFFDNIDRNHDLADAIAVSASKIWFAYADHDVVTVYANDIRTMQTNPNVRVFEIPDSGHISPIDNEPEIESLILRILQTPNGQHAQLLN